MARPVDTPQEIELKLEVPPASLPRVERSLEWIRLAARFPVRIKVENPDDSFRLGASAVATVSGTLRAAKQ